MLLRAGLRGAGSHVVEELEAVPGEGVVVEAQGAAGEGAGGRREEEQERQGAADACWCRGCGPRHGGAWVVLGRSLLSWGWVVVAVVGVPPCVGLYAVRHPSFPLSLSGWGEFPAVVFPFGGCWLWCVRKCVGGVAPSVGRALEVLS